MLQKGDTISHFTILEKLGEGGMGVVYKALDTTLKRTVAIKVLSEARAGDISYRKRLLQEARAACALNSSNIVGIYEIGAQDAMDFIVMEYVDGRPLDSMIPTGGLELKTALRYSIEIAQGLSKAHEQGIIHRDLKPQNIMITGEGEVKIMDFGLAKFDPSLAGPVDSLMETQSRLTRTGVVMGTPVYMSPEQAGGQALDARSDLFSFGSILYEMFTGRRPFGGPTTASILTAILRDEATPLADVRPDLPPELGRIVSKTLEKDLDYRYSSAREIVSDLRRLQRDMATGAVPALRPQRRRRRVTIVAIGIVLCLAVVAALISSLFRGTAPPPKLYFVSTFPGSHSSASFSPDASMITFVSEVNGVGQIWIKNLQQGDPVQLTFEPAGCSRPRWSPTNDQIVFQRGSRENASIWTIPPLGGTPRLVIAGGRNPNWFPDGKRLVFEKGREIWMSNSDGTGPQRVDAVRPPDLLLVDRFPAVSPDGSMLAYHDSSGSSFGDYWIVPLSGGTPRRMTWDWSWGGASTWSADGKSLIIPSTRAGSFNLWKIALSGGQPVPLTTGAGEDSDPDVSRDGKQLIFTSTHKAYTLQLLDPETGQDQVLLKSKHIIAKPSFSPDGKRISFFAGRPDIHIEIFDLQTKKTIQLAHDPGQRNILPQWSSDGSTIYFLQVHPTPSFRRIPIIGGAGSELLPNWTLSANYFTTVDPSGKKVVYCRLVNGEPAESVIEDISSHRRTVLSTRFIPNRWSRDGKLILGWTSAFEILVCPADNGNCRKVTEGFQPVWSKDESRIYFLRLGNLTDGAELWVIPADRSSAERRIAVLKPMILYGRFFDVAADGKIAWTRFDPGEPELWVLKQEK